MSKKKSSKKNRKLQQRIERTAAQQGLWPNAEGKFTTSKEFPKATYDNGMAGYKLNHRG